MNHDAYTDDYLRSILRRVRIIAMVGASPRPNRASYRVMQYLQSKAYRVIPVNPRAGVAEILGEKVYPSLADVPEAIDLVDVFRRSEEAPAVVDAAIARGAKVIWMQIGVRHDAAARQAEQAGLHVVMNRCPKVEYARLCGERNWSGVDTAIASPKPRQL